MPYRFEDRKKMADVRGMGMWGHGCWFAGAIFAILGIIADAIDKTIGLEPTSWFLLAIAAFLAGIPFFISVALAWYLREKK